MNYQKLYTAFIEKYKNQVFESGEYTEVHHIIPRHAGGDDSKENLICLNYKQHVFAHRLLWKIYKRAGDYQAWLMMSKQEVDKVAANHRAIGRANVVSGRLGKIRILANTPERQRKLRELNQYKVDSGLIQTYAKMGQDAWRGQNHTDEWKENKSTQMKAYMETEEGYSNMLKAVELSVKLKKEKSREFSDNVIENAERNEEFLHKTSSRSKSLFISPEGLEFESPIFAANYYGNVEYYVIENWCKREQHGWSRKPKQSRINEPA